MFTSACTLSFVKSTLALSLEIVSALCFRNLTASPMRFALSRPPIISDNVVGAATNFQQSRTFLLLGSMFVVGISIAFLSNNLSLQSTKKS